MTRDLDQADRILDADQRARVLNRADRQLAKDVPVIPFYDSPFVLALRNTVRNVVVVARGSPLERGGLVARALALAAALAVSLLAVSGAGGAARADAEARRHGRLRGTRASSPLPRMPACERAGGSRIRVRS